MYENAETQLELKLENLYHDMGIMNREELETYKERLYTKLYDLEYRQRNKEAEERYWACVNAVYQPH